MAKSPVLEGGASAGIFNVRRFSAASGSMHRSKQDYSIISSARESSEGGRVRPSAFAVFRLIRSSNLVG